MNNDAAGALIFSTVVIGTFLLTMYPVEMLTLGVLVFIIWGISK